MSQMADDDQNEARKYLDRVDFGDGTSTDDLKDEEQTEEPEEEPELSETEIRARNEGWRPREEFKGHPEKWVDAETFLKRGEEVLPLVKAKVKALEERLEAWQKYHVEDRKRVEQRAYERALAEIKARSREAVAQADTETYARIEQEREQLERSHEEEIKAVETAVPTVPPEWLETLNVWKAENPWYQEDNQGLARNVQTQYAKSVSTVVLAENPQWRGSEPEFLQAVAAEVRKRYPDKFGNPMRNAPSSVEAPAGRMSSGHRAKKTYADLPPDARDECARMKRAGMSEKDFVAEYFGQEAYTSSD